MINLNIIKKRNFWINTIIFLSFILPILLVIIGAIGYELLNVEYFHNYSLYVWFLVFGIFYGIPATILVYVIFYFLKKKGILIEQNNVESVSNNKMSIWLKTIMIFLSIILIIIPVIMYLFKILI